MRHVPKLAVTAVLSLLALALMVSFATRTDASEREPGSRISNNGQAVTVRDAKLARALGATQASLLAVRGARAYYRLAGSDGQCVASGPAEAVGELGTVQCPQGPFPSANRPIVDLSVYESTSRNGRELSLYQAAGIASDAVATVEFVRPNGGVALTLRVSGNVFAGSAVPPGPISGLVARDAAGKELWRSP